MGRSMVTIAVINKKGGVGKSTTVHSLGVGLSLRGFNVLYVDMDAQANLTYTLCRPNLIGVYDALREPEKVNGCIQRTSYGDILASTPNLATADVFLTGEGKEYRLKNALQPLRSSYDFCLIDTPPSLGILTINALTAANKVIIPSKADMFSIQGIGQLKGTIDAVKKYCNRNLEVEGILITHYDKRVIVKREIAERLGQTAIRLDSKLFETKIRDCIAIVESQVSRKDIFKYYPKSNAARDYEALVEEVLKDTGNLKEKTGHGKEDFQRRD